MRLSCGLAVNLLSCAIATSHCPSTQRIAAWTLVALAAVGLGLADGIAMGPELLFADLQLQPAVNQTGSFIAG